jgi:L-threonylcarbamoyladenylate synthase
MAQIGTDFKYAKDLLCEGNLVAIPTETVYGLAANGLNEAASLKIFEAKERPFFDPLILHTHSILEVEKYATWHDDRLKKLAEKFWPGALSILLPKKNSVPQLITSGLVQVAVRVPNHPLTLSLLQSLDFPLAAPSANPFGYISPTAAQHVNAQLGNKIAYILDGGECSVGLESTIVGIENNELCIFRLGGISLEEIEACIGEVELKINTSSNPNSPGQLKNHYSPRKPIIIGDVEHLASENRNKTITAITFEERNYGKQNVKNLCLTKNKNMNEAAINLFKFLRMADEDESEIIVAEYVPSIGLGRAINDRLKRAAAK